MPHTTCDSHTAAVLDRDGAVVCSADALVDVEWGRLLDETATARARVVPQGDCCACMGQVRTWRHRLVIWLGSHVVFDGPLTFVEWSADDVTLQALDASGWLHKRLPHSDMTFDATDLSTIARDLVTDAFLPDDVGVSAQIVSPTFIFGDRTYATDVGYVIDHLRDLASTGLDWTVAGSSILLFGESFCEVAGSLSDGDFPQGLRVIEDGAATATRQVMWAGPSGDTKAEAGGVDDYYGLLESLSDGAAVADRGAGSVLDASSAQAAVDSQLDASMPAPVFIDTGRGPLATSAAVDVATLFPGYCLQIASVVTCRAVTAVQKVVEVRCTETGTAGVDARVICAPSTGAGQRGSRAIAGRASNPLAARFRELESAVRRRVV